MVFLWFFYGFSMVYLGEISIFPWFPHGFPMSKKRPRHFKRQTSPGSAGGGQERLSGAVGHAAKGQGATLRKLIYSGNMVILPLTFGGSIPDFSETPTYIRLL